MIAAHVIIFGSGPRLRSICAALVRDCNIDVHILSMESREAAALRAAQYRTQVIFLDARVAVTVEGFVELIRDPRDVVVASAIGWNGEPAAQPAALKTRKPVDPAQLASLFVFAGLRPTIGSWLESIAAPERAPAGVPPVRCHSYGWGFSGYAALSRNLMIGLDNVGVDVAWSADFEESESVDVDGGDRAKLSTMSVARRVNETSLIFHPPTFTDGRPFLGPLCEIFNIHSPIAITMFETDRVPARWAEELSRCDQVWVPATFNVEAFVAGGVPREKLAVVPMGLDFEHTPVDGPRLAIPNARGFTFLAVSEWTYRKGFDVLLAAYARAFNRDDDVTLVIRSHFAGLDVAAEIRQTLKQLGFAPDQIAPILLLPQKLTPSEFSALYRASDAFVLPTRGEGFGVPCLEAMALGVPTISTGWGGSTDFLNERTGFPIAATLKAVPRKDCVQFPIFTGQHWAEPSIASTASAMRRVFDHRADALLVAARGAALARTAYNRETTARHALRALRAYRPRAIAAPHKTGTVSFAGDLLSANGAGTAARGLLRGLESNGLCVEARAPFPPYAPNAVRSDEAAFVKAHLVHRAVGDHLQIVHASLRDLPRLAVGGSTVVVTVADEHVAVPEVLSALRRAALVCVPSVSCATILERSGVEWRRIRIVPMCVDTAFWAPETGLGLGPHAAKLQFLSMIEWHPDEGWETLVVAFTSAFGARDGVELALSITTRDGDYQSHGERCVRDISAVLNKHFPERAASGDLPSITIRVGVVAEEDLALSFGSHDAFVLAPRVRRAGRGFLQAMACGLATIAPRAGAHLAFMNDENSYLVDVSPRESSPSIDFGWEVGVAELAQTLRRVAERSTERASRGAAARRSVVANNALAHAGAALRAIIDQEQAFALAPLTIPEPMTHHLCIVITRSQDTTQIAECIDYIRQYTATASVSVVVRGIAPWPGPHRSDLTEIGMNLDTLLDSARAATHIAFLHDDVRVGPGWDSLLINSLASRVGAAIAFPHSMETSGRADTPVRLGPLDSDNFFKAVIYRETRLIGRGQYVSMIMPACSIVDAAELRKIAETTGAGCVELTDLLRCLLTAHPHAWLAHDVLVHHGASAGQPFGAITLKPASDLIAANR